jgi:hypothetical protein
MAVIGAIRRRLFLLARSEQGMALPTAIFAMIASFGFATAAILSSVNAQRGTHRDRNSKSAIAAADAGASVALMRMNRYIGSFSPTTRCISPSGVEQQPDPEESGWCPATSSEGVGNASFRYWVTAYQKGAPMTVVAVGTSGSVSRRVEVGLISYGEDKVFSGEKFIGESEITLEGNPRLNTDIGTNGNVDTKGSSAEICGDIRHGTGKEGPEPDCGGDKTEGNKTLPEVELPLGIETNNWNCRVEKVIATNCPTDEENVPKEYDPYIGTNGKEKRTATEPWEPPTGTITRGTINIGSGSTLTMGGLDYFICRLFIKGGQLIMPSGAEGRIFFDTPENCGLEDGDVQMELTGNAHITSTAYNSGESNVIPGFYLLGSPSIETEVVLNGTTGGTNELMLYAPNSDITISGNATWIGMAAGKTLRTNGNPTIEADDAIDLPDMNFASLWERTHYVECVGASPSGAPDASC